MANSNNSIIPSIGGGGGGGLLPMSTITLGVGGTSLTAPPTLMPMGAAPPTSAGAAAAAAMESRLLQQQQQQHIISASCSVNSASTLNSTSTKSSTMMPVVGLGGWAVATKPGSGGLGGRGGANAPITINDSGQLFGAFEENNRVDHHHHHQVGGSHDQNYLQPQTNNIGLGGFVEGGGGGDGVGSNNPMMLQMGGAPLHPVAEFLFQLTKMLTENNNEFIEWRNASIFVHDPPGLEREILPKYFRHSNYSSFQRQMNYFGFRKIAGKGKMAPCSYVNQHAKEEISSLLFIKRKKTTISNAATKLMAQQNRINRSIARGDLGIAGNALGLISFNPLGGLNTTGLPGGALSLSNFSLGGVPTGMSGVGTFQLSAPTTGQATVLNQQQSIGNFQLSAAQESSLTNQASLPNQQQNILAQLQQAHALAMTNPPAPLTENKTNSINTNGVVNTGFLTTDQGNVFMSSGNHAIPSDYSTGSNVAMYQPLQIQQATQPLQIQQATPTLCEKSYSDADIRALINQQISMFNTTVSSEQFLWPTMNVNDESTVLSCQAPPCQNLTPLPCQVQPPQGDSSQVPPSLGDSSQQQGGVLNSVVPTVSLPQDLQQIDWNDIFRQMGGFGGFDLVGAPGSINPQQLLQNSNNAGIFGIVGGANDVSQGFQPSYQNPT